MGRFRSMTNLQDLVLDFNDFEASFGEVLNCGNCFETLRLFRSTNNLLTGPIPPFLSNFTKLHQLHIIGSQISGTIPTTLGLLTDLVDLDLSSNNLLADNTYLPSELGMLTNLERFYVAFSFISGQVPGEYGNLSALRELAIHNTFITGTIPTSVCSISNLRRIYHSEAVDCSCPGTICSLPL